MPKLATKTPPDAAASRQISQNEQKKNVQLFKDDRKDTLRKFRKIWASAGLQYLGILSACLITSVMGICRKYNSIQIFNPLSAEETAKFDCNMMGFVCVPNFDIMNLVIVIISTVTIIFISMIMILLVKSKGRISAIISMIMGLFEFILYLYISYKAIIIGYYSEAGLMCINAVFFFALFIFALRNFLALKLYEHTKSLLFDYHPDSRSIAYCLYFVLAVLSANSLGSNWHIFKLYNDAYHNYENIGNELQRFLNYVLLIFLVKNGVLILFFLLHIILLIPAIGFIVPARIFAHFTLLYSAVQMAAYVLTMQMGFYSLASECFIMAWLMSLLNLAMTTMLSKLMRVLDRQKKYYEPKNGPLAKELVNYDSEMGVLIKPAPFVDTTTAKNASEMATIMSTVSNNEPTVNIK